MGAVTASAARHAVVVGLQFGDEGKGQFVDLLAAQHDVVVRYNGGANAGHTVRVAGERFALHLLPSGVLHPHTLNVIAHGVVVDPFGLAAEIDGLAERGVSLGGRLKLSCGAHLVMPWHRAEERLLEAAAAVPVGTTGRGIGPCYADRAQRHTAVRAGELADLDALLVRLRHIARIKNASLAGLAAELEQPFEPVDAAALLAELAVVAPRLVPHLADTVALLHESDAAGKRILFEGANAANLDIDLGTWPFVTSSSTTPLGVPSGAGVPCSWVSRIYGVAKAYTSRVGAGPMPTELHGELADGIRNRGQEFGTTTGRPRRVGWFDAAAVGRMARLTGVTDLCLTGLNVLSGLESVEFQNGERRTLPGWQMDLAECSTIGGIDARAMAYVDEVKAAVGPLSYLCVGPARHQALAC